MRGCQMNRAERVLREIFDTVLFFILLAGVIYLFLDVSGSLDYGPVEKEKTCIKYEDSKVTICTHNHEEYKVYE